MEAIAMRLKRSVKVLGLFIALAIILYATMSNPGGTTKTKTDALKSRIELVKPPVDTVRYGSTGGTITDIRGDETLNSFVITNAGKIGVNIKYVADRLASSVNTTQANITGGLSLPAANITNGTFGNGTYTILNSLVVNGTIVVNGINITDRQISDNTTVGNAIVSENTTQGNLISGNNNTLYAVAGQKLNLTGGTLSSLLNISAASNVNNLSLAVNGTLYVNASGRVGIGTASPGMPLEIVNTADPQVQISSTVTSPRLRLHAVATQAIYEIWKDNTPTKAVAFGMTNPGVASMQDDLILSTYDGTSWSERLRILTSNGNVGIGTASPGAKLDVTGTNSANNLSLSVNNTLYVNNSGFVGIGTSTPASRLDVSGTLTVEGINVTGRQISDNTTIAGNLSTTNTRIGNLETKQAGDNQTLTNLKYNVSGGPILGVVNITGGLNVSAGGLNVISGNVGIGTTNPNTPLHLYANTSTTVDPGLKIEQAGTGDAQIHFLLPGATDWAIGVDNSDSDKFKIGSANDLANSNVITLQTNGNVGIGTTAPNSKLEVNGTANITGGLNVSAGGLNVIAGNVGIGTTASTTLISGGGALVGMGVHAKGPGETSLVIDAPSAQANLIFIQQGAAADKRISRFAYGSAASDALSYEIINDAYTAILRTPLTILNTGNVGIGTTSPGSYKLNVAGTVNATSYTANGTDYAEIIPKLNLTENLTSGDIIGIHSGKASKNTTGAHGFFVVSGRMSGIIAGPGNIFDIIKWNVTNNQSTIRTIGNITSEINITNEYTNITIKSDYTNSSIVPIAFIGQVPVKVNGNVTAGDWLIPSGLNDGNAIAVNIENAPNLPTALKWIKQKIGIAWESSNITSVKLINAAVGT